MTENKTNSVQFKIADFVSDKGSDYKADYKVGPVLGTGAFAEVRRVTHRATGLTRAMKIVKKKAMSAKDMEELKNEISLLKDLDHPSILKLFEFYSDEKRIYVITELLTGGELFDVITEKETFTEQEAAEVMKQVLGAIFYCHKLGVCHRDLKPENLMLLDKTDNMQVKVIDWGTSIRFSDDKPLKQRLGTPYYIAPEVLDGCYNEKCDIWSCGVILYILLSGYPAFGGSDDKEILKNVANGAYDYEAEEWDSVSQEAKDFIDRMLAFDPTERISAEEALADPWIQENKKASTIDKKLASSNLRKLKSFRAEQKLQQATMSFITRQLADEKETDELKKLFHELDADGDGQLSREEIFEGYKKMVGEEEAQEFTDNIFEQCDADGSGTIDYTEFLTATMDKKKMLSKERLEAAFNMFDKDGSGSISPDEIKAVLGGTAEKDAYWDKIIKEIDQDGDGEIQLSEFQDMMIKLYETKED